MIQDIDALAWDKMNGLLPAIVQDAKTGTVLMLGYMDKTALQKTIETQWVTFFSRSKNNLWTKGETSGNKLALVNVLSDCDRDTLLISAHPTGPTCHLGRTACFDRSPPTEWQFIKALEETIQQRAQLRPEQSYTAQLLDAGTSRIAQKVGEESIEVVLAAIEKNEVDFCNEVADLLFHLLILLRAKDLGITDIINILKKRQRFDWPLDKPIAAI